MLLKGNFFFEVSVHRSLTIGEEDTEVIGRSRRAPFVSAIRKIRLVKMSADLDRWIEIAKNCKYLPENELKVIECKTGDQVA